MELHRYIFKQMLYWVFVTTVLLVGMIWLSQALRVIELLVNKGADLKLLFVLTVLTMPLWMMLILPVGVLVATILVFNQLQQDREITAMHAVGLSNLKIARGPLALGVLMSALMYLNSVYILPTTFTHYKTILSRLQTSAPIITLQAGVFTDITKGLTIFTEKRGKLNNFENIFVHDTREEGKIVEILAASGNIDTASTPPRLNFYNGVRSEYSPDDPQTAVLEFETYELSVTRNYKDFVPRTADYNELSIATLLRRGGEADPYSNEMWAEGHYRLASPLLSLTMVVIGLVAILSSRYRRISSWQPICGGILVGMIVVLLQVMGRGLTVTTPSLFVLIYGIIILPLILGFYVLHQKSSGGITALSGKAPSEKIS